MAFSRKWSYSWGRGATDLPTYSIPLSRLDREGFLEWLEHLCGKPWWSDQNTEELFNAVLLIDTIARDQRTAA